MNKRIILLLIIVYYIFSRLYLFNEIPLPLNSGEHLRPLFLPINFICLFFLYHFFKLTLNKVRGALIGLMIFIMLPPFFEQSRIVSGFGLYLLLCLSGIYFFYRSSKLLYRLFALMICFIPHLYEIGSIGRINLNFGQFISNILYLISPVTGFVSNQTFYFGGIKDFGLIFLSLIPFFLLGLIVFGKVRHKLAYTVFISSFLVSAISPFFPETRFFYLSLVLYTVFITVGISRFFESENKIITLLGAVLLLFMLYEASSYLHYYFVHYPHDLMKFPEKINGPF